MPENKSEQTVAPTEARTPAAKKPLAGTTVAGKAESAEPVAVAKPQRAKPAAAKPATKPSRLEETKAKNKKALADALAKAQAVKLAQPPSLPPVTKTKATKGKKPKLVRHAFSMPEIEYAQIATLKKRIASLGGNVKRSELLRAGLALLAVLDNVELTAVMARVDRLKTGRPAKKG
jgi:ribosomal protein S18